MLTVFCKTYQTYLLAVFLALCCIIPSYAAEPPEKRWLTGVFGGQLLDNDLISIPFSEWEPINSYLWGVFLGKEIGWYKDKMSFEWEGQFVHHSGVQNHQEFNGLVTSRWHPFFWDKWVDTNFGVGGGLSYASEKPKYEFIEQQGKTSELLFYLMLEIELVVPKYKDWSAFGRVHHRSGIFGTINDVSGGSNALVGGIRFRF